MTHAPRSEADLCYCLENDPGGMTGLAAIWRRRSEDKNIVRAVAILKEKFATVDAFGPQQLVEFHADPNLETQAMHARRAYEVVQRFLGLL